MTVYTKEELDYLAMKIAENLKVKNERPFISQRKAYEEFGAGTVQRWVNMGLISPAKRKGIIEYPRAKLKELSLVKQDYFDTPTLEQRRIAKR